MEALQHDAGTDHLVEDKPVGNHNDKGEKMKEKVDEWSKSWVEASK